VTWSGAWSEEAVKRDRRGGRGRELLGIFPNREEKILEEEAGRREGHDHPLVARYLSM
jgi:hypothetical protein